MTWSETATDLLHIALAMRGWRRTRWPAGQWRRSTIRRMEIEKHEAVGQRGEACIIILRNVTLPNGGTEPAYSLATGERLRPTGAEGEFETLNGSRTFRLRRVATSLAKGPAPGSSPEDGRAGASEVARR